MEMRKRKTKPKDIQDYIRNAVSRMLHLKLKTGTTIDELRAFSDQCLVDAARLHRAEDLDTGFDLHAIADVLRTWHTKTQFMTSSGLPRPLSSRGSSGLRRLVGTHFAPTEVSAVIKVLAESGLLARKGSTSWVPKERYGRIPKATTEILRHLAEGVSRFTETVTRNTQAGRGGDILFERACKVFHLPPSDAQAFRAFVQKQGILFISSVDDWLEGRVAQTKLRKKKGCIAGAFCFAFMDDEKQSKPSQFKIGTERSVRRTL
jgi:hypothetical protein